MKTTTKLSALAAILFALSACGGTDRPSAMLSDGMWSSANGKLSCVGSTPQPGPDDLTTCEWKCVEVDGVMYPEVLLAFAMGPGAAEWRLMSQAFMTGPEYEPVGGCK